MEKMLDKKSRDFAKNMRDTMIYDKSKNELQIGTNLYVDGKITSATPSEGGKVYLHNIYIDAGRKGYMKLYTTSNEPFTKETLGAFMSNNGMTSRIKGFPLSYDSVIANVDNVAKNITFNFVAFAVNGSLRLSTEDITFNVVENNVTLTRQVDNTWPARSITDTVIEL